MTHNRPLQLWRRLSGPPLAFGMLATLLVVLLIWAWTPAETTPVPPTLPLPAESVPPAGPEAAAAAAAADEEATAEAPEAEPAGEELDGVPDGALDGVLDGPEQRAAFVRTCERIAGKLGSVSLPDCTESRLGLSGARSVQGTPILVAEYPPLPDREPLGRVLLFGGIHGDELSSVSIVYTWLDILDRFHSGLFHWRIAPLVNPDGLLRDKPQRMNDRGVDLNRNFPSPNWLVEAPDYWIRRTSRNPRRYPGEAPLSEPESQWLHEQIEHFRPAAIVAVHAPSHVVDYDGPPEPPKRLGPLYLKQMGTYPGSLGRFAGIHLGLPVVTIELPSAGIMPSHDDQRRMWVDLVSWLRRNVPNQRAERLARAEAAAASAPAAAPTTGMER